MADRSIEVTLRLTTAQFQQAMRQAGNAAGDFDRATQKAAQGAKTFTRNMADVYQSLMAVKTGYHAVTGSIEQFIAVGERAASRARYERMFTQLSGGAAQATVNLTAMRKALQYTISEADAMESAIGLLGLGLARTPDELAQISQQVALLGRKFAGLSSQQSIMQFMLAVSNQSTQRLTEFGLNATEVTRRVQELTAAGYAADEAFKMATLEGLNTQFERLGGSSTDAMTAFEQYRAAVEDLTAQLEEQFLPTALRVVEALRDIATLASGGFQTRAAERVGEILAGSGSPEEFAASVERALAVTTSPAGRRGLGPTFEQVRQQILETAKTQEELNAGIEVYNRLLDEYVAKMPAIAREAALRSGLRIEAQSLLEVTQEYVDLQETRAQAVAAAEREAGRERAAAVLEAAQKVVDIEAEMAEKRREILADFHRQAADRERQRARDAQLAALRAGWAQSDADRHTVQQRLQIHAQYQQAIARAEEAFAQAQARAAQQYARRQEDIERQHQQRLAAIQRQYEQDEFEATLNRDAAALFRARRRRTEQISQAEQQRAEQQRQAQQQYQDALAAAQQARQAALEQARHMQRESLAQLEQSLRDEQEAQRRADERQRVIQALQEAWLLQDQNRYLAQRLGQVVAGYSAELQAAQSYYSNLIRMENNYRASRAGARGAPAVPSSGGGSRPQAFAQGGYTAGGLALLHAGEFVLNPQTTRQLEGMVGGGLTQQNVVNRGLTVHANFTGVGASDRSWIEQRLGDFSRELAGYLQ